MEANEINNNRLASLELRLVTIEVQLAERSVQWDNRMESLEETLDARLGRVEKILISSAGSICLGFLGLIVAVIKYLPKG